MIEVKDGHTVNYLVSKTCEHRLLIPMVVHVNFTTELRRVTRCWICGSIFETPPPNSLILGTDGVSIP